MPFIVSKTKEVGFGFSPTNAVYLQKAKSAPELYHTVWPFLRSDKTPLPDSLDALFQQIETGGRPFICPLDGAKVRAFLHRVAKEPCSEKELKAAKLLDSINYSTCKSPVQAIIRDTQSQKMLSRDAAIAKIRKGCSLKVEGIANCKKGEIMHPSYRSWMAIVNSPIFDEKWGEKVPDNDPVWDNMRKTFFTSSPTGLSHNKARKVYSLPLICSPSGGFRIGRRNPFKTLTWQTVATDGTYSGFAVSKGSVNFGMPILLDNLNSRNIHSLGSRYVMNGEYAPMDAWREIELEEDEKGILRRVFLAPGTATRMYARLELHLETMARLLDDGLTSDQLDSVLHTEMKIPPARWKTQTVMEKYKGRADKPTTIFVLGRDQECVVIRYVIEGNATLKHRYNMAYQSESDETSGGM